MYKINGWKFEVGYDPLFMGWTVQGTTDDGKWQFASVNNIKTEEELLDYLEYLSNEDSVA